MKVVHISASYNPAYVYGGPTMSITKLCNELIRYPFTGIKISVLTTTANGKAELPVIPGVTIDVTGVPVTYFKRITKDHSHFSPGLLIALYRKLSLSKRKPIVHIHAWWNWVSILACTVALMGKATVVLSPRGTLSNYSFYNRKSILKRLLHKLIGKYLLERCHFHVTTTKEKNDILYLVKPKSISIIPNFVELPPQRKRIAAKSRNQESLIREAGKKLQLLFLSRLEEKKGLELLLQAVSLVTFPWSLTIAGDGKPRYVQRLKDLAADLGLGSELHWAGHLNNKEKFKVLASHDLLVLPSYDENFANVVIESIAMGTPVLISSKVGLADYVEEHKLGMICSQDPHSIKDALNNFFAGKHRFNSQHFQSRVEHDFDELQLAGKYIKLYKSLI